MKQPVILFGLSANPIHAGHLHMAEQAHQQVGAAQTHLLITPGHNLKKPRDYAPFSKRMHMAELATADHPHLHVSDFEAHTLVKNEDARTWEVLQAWQQAHPDAQPIWLMGADSWQTFHQWEGHERILATMPVLIAPRPGYHPDPLSYPVGVQQQALRLSAEDLVNHKPGWFWLDIPTHPASATKIRQDVLKQIPNPHLNPAVQAYLHQHGLYQK